MVNKLLWYLQYVFDTLYNYTDLELFWKIRVKIKTASANITRKERKNNE